MDRLPSAALFDWDGTIVDTLELIYRANVVVLGELGITLSREWFRDRYTPDWRSSYRELGIPESLWDATAERWSQEMRNARPRALPGALPALRRLRRRGVRLGLVTASTRSVVEPNLRRLNIGDLFEAARFADDVANGKPHPEALIAALDEMGVAPADSVYIGDTVVDLQMASAAGAPFVAVGTTTRPEAFRAAGADPVWAGIADWTDVLLGPRRPAPRRGAATTRDPVRPARQRGPADG